MELALSIAGVIVVLGVMTGTLLALPATWHAVRPHWQRASREARRRAITHTAIGCIAALAVLALSIIEVFGPHTILYFLAANAVVAIACVHRAVAAEILRARRRRRAGG